MRELLSSKRVRYLGGGVLSILLFLLIWYCATQGTKLGILLSNPIEVIRRFVELLYTPLGEHTLWGHALWSLSRFLIGFVIASVCGILLGTLMGWYRVVEAIFKPIFNIFRPIPPIAWIPLGILWFGIGEKTKYFLIFLAAFFAVALNSYDGARSVDKTIINAAKMLGAKDRQLFTSIVLPSAVPHIFAGLQVAMASGWATVMAAEMVRSTQGVGWIIIVGQEMGNMTQVLVGILCIGVIGFLLAIIMRGAEAKLCAWNERGK